MNANIRTDTQLVLFKYYLIRESYWRCLLTIQVSLSLYFFVNCQKYKHQIQQRRRYRWNLIQERVHRKRSWKAAIHFISLPNSSHGKSSDASSSRIVQWKRHSSKRWQSFRSPWPPCHWDILWCYQQSLRIQDEERIIVSFPVARSFGYLFSLGKLAEMTTNPDEKINFCQTVHDASAHSGRSVPAGFEVEVDGWVKLYRELNTVAWIFRCQQTRHSGLSEARNVWYKLIRQIHDEIGCCLGCCWELLQWTVALRISF